MDFRVFNGVVVPLEEQVKAAAAAKQQQKEALVRIEKRKLNYFIKTPNANGFCVLEYSKLQM